jgi:hypothetical protein
LTPKINNPNRPDQILLITTTDAQPILLTWVTIVGSARTAKSREKASQYATVPMQNKKASVVNHILVLVEKIEQEFVCVRFY